MSLDLVDFVSICRRWRRIFAIRQSAHFGLHEIATRLIACDVQKAWSGIVQIVKKEAHETHRAEEQKQKG